ncbi:hypothetical protein KJ644_04710 [Candidatus Dependentiae bacterium]|nr:hypothetical protein [Candidatus Dependentiae bacterium]MBU4387739.1 hypothetical protein [Candidatus Dependentiae bacterium]MCG2756331.1 hypothetical protein [Candidatus Dependentiae bacterium]
MNKKLQLLFAVIALSGFSNLFSMGENSIIDLFDEKTIKEIIELPNLGKNLPGYLVIGKDNNYYLVYKDETGITIEKNK